LTRPGRPVEPALADGNPPAPEAIIGPDQVSSPKELHTLARAESGWESLIEVSEIGQPKPGARRAVRQTGSARPSWFWPCLGAAALALGLVGAWAAGVIKVKTKDGYIVLTRVPEQASVTVDGERVSVQSPQAGGPLMIPAPAGRHGVQVEKDGFETLGESVSVKTGEEKGIAVHLEPLPDVSANRGLEHVARPPKGVSASRPVDLGMSSVIRGQWHVEGEELIQTDARFANPVLLLGDARWTDYDFSADAMRIGGAEAFSLFFRATCENARKYAYVVSARGNKTCYVEADAAGKVEVLQSHPLSLLDHKWYTARGRVRGSHFECFLSDGEKENKLFDLDDERFKLGRVGLRTWYSAYRFKHIKVTAPDGSVLWEGPPAIDLLAEFGPGFTTDKAGLEGLAIVNGHFGHPRALRTHSEDRKTPCVLRSTLDLPANQSARLVLAVSHHPQGDWRLVVRANGRVLHSEIIGAKTTKNGWKEIAVDLSEFAGRKVNLELLNEANDSRWDNGYWGRIAIVTEVKRLP
jgi:hypothetical protein